MENSEEDLTGYKLAILGLSNAGKTSVIKVLLHQFEILSKITPTQSVERTRVNFLAHNLIFWDFGGQDSYRIKYLDSPERYFSEIGHLFYTIDIQDRSLLGESILYFQAVLKRVKKYSPDVVITLLFHKFDPDLKNPEIGDKIEEEFLNAVSEDLEEGGFGVTQFFTSIYDPLTIVKAISKSLFDNKEIKDNVSRILEMFANDHEIKFMSLLSDTFLEIGFYIEPQFAIEYEKELPEMFKHFYHNVGEGIHPVEIIEFPEGRIQLLSSKFIIKSGEYEKPYYFAIGLKHHSDYQLAELEVYISQLILNLQKIFMNINLSDILNGSA